MAMKAKITAEEHGKLPTHFKTEYKEQEDGSFLLDVESVGGLVLEDVAGLKTVLGEKKAEIAKLKKDFEKYKDLDPEKARQALDELSKIGNLTADEKVKALVESTKKQLLEKHAGETKSLTDRIALLTSAVNEQLVDARATAVLAKLEGNPKLLLNVIRQHTRVVEENGEFRVEVIDPVKKVPLTSMKPGSTDDMDIEEFVEGLKKNPDYQGAFKGTNASGSGASGSNGQRGSGKGGKIDYTTPPEQRLADIRAAGKVTVTRHTGKDGSQPMADRLPAT